MTQYSQSPMGGSGTSSATGASNPYYNLISVLYHTLQAAETYDTYIRDAEQLGDNELTQFLRQVQTEDRNRAQFAMQLLARRLGAGQQSTAR